MNLVGKTTTQAHKDAARRARNERHGEKQKQRGYVGVGTIGTRMNPPGHEDRIRKLREYYARIGASFSSGGRGKPMKIYRDVETGKRATAIEWAKRLGTTRKYIHKVISRGGQIRGVRLERAA